MREKKHQVASSFDWYNLLTVSIKLFTHHCATHKKWVIESNVWLNTHTIWCGTVHVYTWFHRLFLVFAGCVCVVYMRFGFCSVFVANFLASFFFNLPSIRTITKKKTTNNNMLLVKSYSLTVNLPYTLYVSTESFLFCFLAHWLKMVFSKNSNEKLWWMNGTEKNTTLHHTSIPIDLIDCTKWSQNNALTHYTQTETIHAFRPTWNNNESKRNGKESDILFCYICVLVFFLLFNIPVDLWLICVFKYDYLRTFLMRSNIRQLNDIMTWLN